LVGFNLNAHAASDPMKPPRFAPVTEKKAAQKKASFTLQQIKMSQKGASAVINGKLVKEGDTVSGARVVRITSDKVVLKYRQKLKTLSLLSNTKHSGK
jgi:MSHA biogenesis protein MshK